jgi:hypothetical protein
MNNPRPQRFRLTEVVPTQDDLTVHSGVVVSVHQSLGDGEPFLFVMVDNNGVQVRADWGDCQADPVNIRPWGGNPGAAANPNVYPGMRIQCQLWDDGAHGRFAYNVVPA